MPDLQINQHNPLAICNLCLGKLVANSYEFVRFHLYDF